MGTGVCFDERKEIEREEENGRDSCLKKLETVWSLTNKSFPVEINLMEGGIGHFDQTYVEMKRSSVQMEVAIMRPF
ncbi:hypothetical protein PDIG_72020 [Penicillium digitatum PHI26]|uniref:Uncharacterized protein n=2 Tax=Penicillium digitatum TaxID=36651 RepID=K9FEF7_PEND2|nr:hypothetical protein PDIP_81290 [Penicillium digitatum Pd1]EKV05773.1 hypothetical protein PDIP_81290 [Penicillium digitatum Pd1]EKV07589.1 hypothetical protein PDIG_72020 [Penicillium digitatum PHI26]